MREIAGKPTVTTMCQCFASIASNQSGSCGRRGDTRGFKFSNSSRLAHSVIAGFDPAIHLLPRILAKMMDARIKSGHDGHFLWASRFRDTTSRSRGLFRPSFARNLLDPPIRGRREYRVRAAPAVSCAKRAQKHAHEHTGSAETLRHSLRNGFTAYSVLSPVSRALLPPSPARLNANLTPASGCQEHTSLPYAHAPFVYRRIRVHRIPPRGHDDRVSPLCGAGRGWI